MKLNRIPTLRQILILIMIGVLSGGCSGPKAESTKIPVAQKGVLALRSWNFERNGSINLNGEWEFYWEQLLAPVDFTETATDIVAPRLTGTIRVPGSWWGYPLKNKKTNPHRIRDLPVGSVITG